MIDTNKIPQGTTIYVVRFAPSEVSDAAVGGMDWTLVREEALARLRKHMADGPGHDFSYREHLVPRDMTKDEITTHFDDGEV